MDTEHSENKNSQNKKIQTEDIFKTKDKKIVWFLVAGIILISFLVYSPIHKSDFINWDDNLYVKDNPDIQGMNMEHLKKVFSKNYVATYLPMTMLSYSLDYKIGALNPRVYKYTNLVLHIINSLLVFWFVLLLIGQLQNSISEYNLKKSYLIAAITSILFALHPINVESVIWIAERKNVLFAFFYLLSLIAYFRFAVREKYWLYILSLFLFVCALLSKGTAVSLSLSIILLDYFLKRNLLSRKVIFEKIPFFILSLVFGFIAVKAQGHENIVLNHPFYEQLAFASYGFIQYLCKLLVPANLSGYYSYPVHTIIHWIDFGLVIILFSVLIKFRKHLSQLIIFGILFFMLNLILLIQVIPVGNTIMADRYIYIPSFGFFLIGAVLISEIKIRASAVYFIITIIFLLYGFSTIRRVKIWSNSLIFWNDVIQKDTNIPVAWLNRGTAKNELGDIDGAFNDINRALQIKPDYDIAYYNRGNIFKEKGNLKAAAADYSVTISIRPDYVNAYVNRGNAKLGMGDYQGSFLDYDKVINLDTGLKEAYNGRGIIYVFAKKYLEAMADFTKAISLDPKYADAYYDRGRLLKIMKKYPEALVDLNKSIQLDAQNMKYFLIRAKVYLKLKNYDYAINDCNSILDKNKNMTNAIITRAAAYYLKGSYNDALNDLETVISQNSNISATYYIRGLINFKLGNKLKGESDLVHAKKLGFIASESDYDLDAK
jgi:protein O-mannosyl-transferase